MEKSYVDGPAGQIHTRHWDGSAGAEASPSLLCLHPAPYSGAYFETVAPLLTERWQVIAPDYPGYGGSSPCRGEASISDYAAAMAAVADDVSPSTPVDVLGFHTGCLVAIEMAAMSPDRVRRLILIDVPYFDAATREAMLTKFPVPKPLSTSLDGLADAWGFTVTKRLDDMPLSRAYELFVEQARAGEGTNAAFRAAFSYPCEDRFSTMMHSTTIIATQSGLLEASRNAAKAMPHAALVERLDIKRSVMEEAALQIAPTILSSIGDEAPS